MRCTCLTLVALLACGEEPRVPPPPPPPPHDGVTLIHPGASPRQPLRYQLTKGSRTTSQLTCDADVKTANLGGPMPTQVIDLETLVDDVLPDGSAKLRITVLDARIRERPGADAANDVMRTQAAALRGVVIRSTLAPDGHASGARVESGSDKLHDELDNLLRSLEHVATRLPTEPVGVGALWRERRTLPEGGVRAISEMTYVLSSVSGTTIHYASTGELSGAPQTIDQDGTRLEVTDTHGRSTATGSVDLSRYALEVTASSRFATTMKVVSPAPGSADGASTIEIAMAIGMTSRTPTTATASDPPSPPAPAAPPAPATDTASDTGHGGR